MKTLTKSGKLVESWYDRRSRNHITQVKDENGFQVGDAEVDGDCVSRDYSHKQLVQEYGGKAC